MILVLLFRNFDSSLLRPTIMRKVLFILVLLIISTVGYSQEQINPDQTKLFYRSYLAGGGLIHSNGFGLNFIKAKRIDGFKQRLLTIELVNMKHKKEYKSFNPYFDDSKSFVFGKLNSLTILRPSYGRQRALYTKDTKRGVQIGYIWTVGPSIGFVKPIYLEIAEPSVVATSRLETEKYDPVEHTQDVIYGRAPVLNGIDELRIFPGGQAKFGLNFEYAPGDDQIRAVETGVILDVFYKEVPIMAFTENNQLFFSFYLNWQFGKKSF